MAYIVVAIIFIVLEGYYFDVWHVVGRNDPWIRKNSQKTSYRIESFNIPRLQQTLINGLGSIIGWIVGYYLLFYRLRNGLSQYHPRLSDLLLFFLAYYGIVGQLPNVMLVKIFEGPDILKKWLGRS